MPTLEALGVSKHFGGLQAVSDVSFTVDDGEVVGLIGPNGAGKSTIFNLLTGVHRLTAGEIGLAGRRIDGLRPSAICALGIARTFQKIRIFRNLTVAKNVSIGQHCRTRAGLLASVLRPRWARLEEERVVTLARELLGLVGLAKASEELAGNLSHGDQRLLEIARALASRPRVLLLDEPAAGLFAADTERVIGIIRTIRSRGVGIVVVEHDMNVIMGISDRIVVLNHGRKIFEGNPAAARQDREVQRAYLGEADDDA